LVRDSIKTTLEVAVGDWSETELHLIAIEYNVVVLHEDITQNDTQSSDWLNSEAVLAVVRCGHDVS